MSAWWRSSGPVVHGGTRPGARSVPTRGWVRNRRRVLRRGDAVAFAGHNGMYPVAADANTDAEGQTTIALEAPLVAPLSDGEQLAHRRSRRHEAESWVKSVVTALIIWVLLTSYLVEAFRIPSPSMENTLLVGDFLFVEKLVYGGALQVPRTGIRCCRAPAYGEPVRDGIVVFRSVEDSTPNLNVVKRLVGMPGDTLQMVSDTLVRNGVRLPEPYVLRLGLGIPDDAIRMEQMRRWQLPHYRGRDTASYRPSTHDWGPLVIPPVHYFVMGDNRDASYDSRYWGFLPKEHIVGRPLFIYFSIATDPLRVRWNRIFRHPR